jgi:hypothetical protein
MIPNGVSLVRSRAPVYLMHDKKVRLIEGTDSGSLAIRQYTSVCRSCARTEQLSNKLTPTIHKLAFCMDSPLSICGESL